MYDRLYALAKEIDGNVRRLEEAVLRGSAQLYRHPIAGGLGTVTVSGGGQLLEVVLERRRLSVTTGRALGAHVAQAISEAEAHTAATLEQQVHEARRVVH